MEIFLSSCLCIFISNILKIILLSYSHQLYLCNFFVKRFLYTYTCIRMYVHTQMYEPICNSKAAVFPKITVCNEIFFPERWQSPNIRTYVRTHVYKSLSKPVFTPVFFWNIWYRSWKIYYFWIHTPYHTYLRTPLYYSIIIIILLRIYVRRCIFLKYIA